MSESVTGRSWFSYRYAVPGLVFIMLIAMINIDPVIGIVDSYNILSMLDIAALGVLVFLSSPALGFILTQIWYRLFDFNRVRNWFSKEWIHLLREQNIQLDEHPLDTDYWITTTLLKNEFLSIKYQGLKNRRDLFHTFCSTGIIAGISLLIGYTLRFVIFVRVIQYNIIGSESLWQNMQYLILTASLLIVVLCWRSATRIRQEYSRIMTRLITDHLERVKQESADKLVFMDSEEEDSKDLLKEALYL